MLMKLIFNLRFIRLRIKYGNQIIFNSFRLKLNKNKHISATVLPHHVVLMLNCRGVILQRDKYRDSQSQTFTFYACLILCSYQLNVDLIFMQCSHREKPHLRRRAAASIGAKPYMVLA